MGEAFRLMSAALKINGQAPELLMNFANVLHALKRDAEALDCLDKALALAPGDPDALLNRGNALLALGPAAGGARLFRRACWRATRARPTRLLGRGGAHAALGRTPSPRSPTSTQRWRSVIPARLYNRGNALAELGRYAEAVPPSIARWPWRPTMRRPGTIAATRLTALKRHQEAVESFGKAIALQKDYADAHLNRALALLGSGRLATRLSRIRMALAAQRHDRHAPRLRPPALARRISAGAQDNPAACRTRPGRHHPVCALRAAAGAHGRDRRARSAGRS